MKKFMKKCKRALVVALAIALVGTSVDLSMLYVQAESESGVVANVSDGDAQNIVGGAPGNNVQDKANGDAQNMVGGAPGNNGQDKVNGDAQNDAEAGTTDADGSQNKEENGEGTIEYASIEPMWYELPAMETSAMPMGFFSLQDGVVSLKSTNEVEWIDRLDLSGDATVIRDFYDKLAEWTDNDGTEDWLITGEVESYTIATLSGTVENAELLDMTEIGTAVNEIVNTAVASYGNYITAAVNAFDRDYPEVFWLSGGASYGGGAGTYNSIGEYSVPIEVNLCSTSFDMRAEGYRDVATIQTAIATMNTNADNIVNAAEGMSVVEKIRYFNEQLTHKNEYNTSSNLYSIAHECRECTSALAGSEGVNGPVCEGYARAFKVLCDKAKIPCVLVDGWAKNANDDDGEPHMWNYVQVDNSWYGVDVTWNDPKYTYNGVVQGGAVSSGENENWLLVGSDTKIEEMTFTESHPVENQVSSAGVAFTNGPVLSAEKYSNYVASIITDSGAEIKYEDITKAFDAANRDGMNPTLKLLQSVELTDGYIISGVFTLDLNGCTLDLGESNLYISSETAETPEGSLTIKDSSADGAGKICSSNTSHVIWNDGALFMRSGIVAAERTEAYAEGYVIDNRGTLDMTGGLVTGNAWHGVGIRTTRDGLSTITGGTVQGSTHAESHSGIAAGIDNYGTLIISGTAKVCGGAESEAIWNFGTLKVSGMANLVSGKDSVAIKNVAGGSSFEISGAPMLTGEVADIRLYNATISITGALTGTDSYSVQLWDANGEPTLGVFACGGADTNSADISIYTITAEDMAKFTTDSVGIQIKQDTTNNQLLLAYISHDHGAPAPFEQPWTATEGTVAAGSYYLAEDVDAIGAISVEGIVAICLNGHTLNRD